MAKVPNRARGGVEHERITPLRLVGDDERAPIVGPEPRCWQTIASIDAILARMRDSDEYGCHLRVVES